MNTKPISIVGGGLAGLTLGIGLRQRGVPVVIWEAGVYPRHRVCGEFISGRGLETMQRLGLREALEETPTRPASTAIFFAGEQSFRVRKLPSAALCVTRHQLDARLAERFRELGGELRCGARWKPGEPAEGMVQASGRPVRKEEAGWHWYGLKAHARHLELAADLEIHIIDRGYIGLCRLADGLVNVCGLFRRRPSDPGLPRDIAARFCRESEGALGRRLAGASWIEGSTCAVAGLAYRQELSRANVGCVVGDARAMIPPVTGNGMSMAFEAAELALEPLLNFSNGRTDWRTACEHVGAYCHHAFARRLRGAHCLHRAMFSPLLRGCLLPLMNRSEVLWRFFFQVTR